ncbi:MAG TPA: ABC transporter ATP-binding protein [Verrucomicrobiae bacterium]|nr:ABC transporter ATP-binding protein [Verrucomicrobiae bacterium]
MEAVVSVKNLSIVYKNGLRALEDVSLELPRGKITGFIGPSGAGKTTLIRVLVGRQRIADGSATVLGEPVGSARLRGQFSYMTQNLSVYPDLTVTENLSYFAHMLELYGSASTSAVHEAIQTVDLTPQALQVVSSLSGGQKQRVSLAVALLGDPPLLFLDEPTVGLDPVLREQLWKLFRELARSGKTVIVTSHVMDEADRCDDLVLIRSGKVLAHASPHELCTHTHSKTVEEGFIKLVEQAA